MTSKASSNAYIRLVANPTNTAVTQQLTDAFAAIDVAVDSARDFPDDDGQHDPNPLARSP